MNTIIYYDRDSETEALIMAERTTALYGSPPRLMLVGLDVTKSEVEDLCTIDLDQMEYPVLTSADTDTVIDINDTDEEVEISDDEVDSTWDYALLRK